MNLEQTSKERGISKQEEILETIVMLSAMNQSTDGRRSIQSSSPGPCQTDWKEAHCETSAPQLGTSS
jgi:hypothetical protein